MAYPAYSMAAKWREERHVIFSSMPTDNGSPPLVLVLLHQIKLIR